MQISKLVMKMKYPAADYINLRLKFREKLLNLISSNNSSWNTILHETNIPLNQIEKFKKNKLFLFDIVDRMELEKILDFQIEYLLEEVWEEVIK